MHGTNITIRWATLLSEEALLNRTVDFCTRCTSQTSQRPPDHSGWSRALNISVCMQHASGNLTSRESKHLESDILWDSLPRKTNFKENFPFRLDFVMKLQIRKDVPISNHAKKTPRTRSRSTFERLWNCELIMFYGKVVAKAKLLQIHVIMNMNLNTALFTWRTGKLSPEDNFDIELFICLLTPFLIW